MTAFIGICLHSQAQLGASFKWWWNTVLVLWLHPIFSFQRMIANTVRTVKFCRSQSFSKCIATSAQSALPSVATVITTNSVCTRTEKAGFQWFFHVLILWFFTGWNILQEALISPFSSCLFQACEGAKYLWGLYTCVSLEPVVISHWIQKWLK